jgi:two-component system response regulator FixJ
MLTNVWTINVIDDDLAICETTRGLLQSVGYEVACFSSAEDFLARIDKSAPGCALVDICMPGIDGLQLVARLRREAPHLAIVVTSGRLSEEAIQAATALGATVLPKPFLRDKLMNAIVASIKACLDWDGTAKQAI